MWPANLFYCEVKQIYQNSLLRKSYFLASEENLFQNDFNDSSTEYINNKLTQKVTSLF